MESVRGQGSYRFAVASGIEVARSRAGPRNGLLVPTIACYDDRRPRTRRGLRSRRRHASEPEQHRAAVSNRRGLIAAATVLALLVVAAVAYALVPGGRDPDAGAAERTVGPSSTHPDAATGTATPDITASGSSTDSVAPTSGAGHPPAAVPPPAGNPVPGMPRPAAPSGITAVATGIATVHLQWIDHAHDETGFVVLRENGERVELGANTTTYTWTGLPALQHICFTVGVYNAAGWSSDPFPSPLAQDWACADTPSEPPTAPSGLIAEAVDGTTIVLTLDRQLQQRDLLQNPGRRRSAPADRWLSHRVRWDVLSDHHRADHRSRG